MRYNFSRGAGTFKPSSSLGRSVSMWRYADVLPEVEPVTLGEGLTPILSSRRHKNVFIKDEGLNPTGSFKARGLSLAVTMARHYGIKKVAMPSAGNAAGALAAYAAAAGIEAHIFMPKDVPQANLLECRAYGASVTLVNGLIDDCARIINDRKEAEGWFDISTLKEPFRVEGKKTMGYEIAEQFAWELPDVIVCPSGGGVGLIGMWKAFSEMELLGWIGAKRPRMIAVQAEGCAPIVAAFNNGEKDSLAWQNAHTFASGLRVPKAYGDYLILDILRKSGGAAVAVSDDQMREALKEWANDEGLFAAPEGAASLAGYRKLLQDNLLQETGTTVLFNTGNGLKYQDVLASDFAVNKHTERKIPAARHIGGIIGPY